MSSEFEPVGAETKYEGKIFTVREETFRHEDGEESTREIVRHTGAVGVVCHDGAAHAECDVDVVSERLFIGYRQKPSAPAIVAAEAALRACGYEPKRIVTGGGSDANALEAAGFSCVNLANGTERNHEPTERVAVAALEGMLDVAFALLDEAAEV
jgi:di/tripeptidase